METLTRRLAAAALAACVCTATPLTAADPTVVEQLVRQAQFWDARNRHDLAREAWTRVLDADPDNLAALQRLVELESQAGNATRAAEYEGRLRARGAPLAAPRQAGPDREAILAQARNLARAGQAEDAVAAYRPLLDASGRPPNDLALEYYETLAGTRGGWEAARAALQREETARPDEPRYALAHARVLTYRDATRRDGIRRLEALAARHPPLQAEARTAQRNALIWLAPQAADRALYERWLAGAADDTEIRQKLETLAEGQRAQVRAAAEVARGQALRAGYDALNAGDLEGAERFFATRVNANAADADARAGLGLVRLRQQRFGDAATLLERAIAQKPALRPNLAEALASSRYWRAVGQARAEAQRNRWREAADAYAEALRVQPQADADVRRDYAVALRQLKQNARAEAVLRDGLKQDPDSPVLIGELGDLLLADNREDEAEKLVELVERRQPGALRQVRTTLLRSRAAQALAAGNRRQAESLLQQALAADPQNAWIRLDLARLYRGQGRGPEADTLLQALTETDDETSPDVTLAQAFALSESQRWYETLVVLERLPPARRDAATARLQRSAWIHYQLQRAEQAGALGDPGEAVEYLNAAIVAAGDDPEFASAIAQGWQAMGDPARAVAALRKAFAQRAPSAGDSLQYASLLLELGQDAEFEAVTTQLIRSNTMSTAQHATLEDLIVGYRIKLADRLRERGRIAEAYTQLREVVLRYPSQPRVQMALSRLFVSAGDTDKALAIAHALMRSDAEVPGVRLSAIDAALAAGDRDRAAEWLAQARNGDQSEDPALDRAGARLAELRGNRAESLRLLRRAAELEDLERRDSMLPALALIEPGSDGPLPLLPGPVRELLQDEGETVGPLLPRAGDDGPTPVAPAMRHGPYRLDAGLRGNDAGGGRATTATSGNRVNLRLDERAPAGATAVASRSAPVRMDTLPQRQPTLHEEVRRLEASLGPWVTGNFLSRSRRGEAGLSRLLALELPFDYVTPEWEAGRFGVRVKPVVLDAGTVAGRNKMRFGTWALFYPDVRDADQSADGVALSLDYRIGELSLDVGTTPIGFPIENVVGGLRYQTRPSDALTLSGEVSRRPVTDSLLSYAGSYDEKIGRHWGGVMRTGTRLDLAYDLGSYGMYGAAAYYGLGGRNVEDNSVLEFGGGLFFRALRNERFGDLTVGLNLTTFGYDQNLRHFTLGHGGYFSPQFFTAVTIPTTWSGRYGRLDYRLDAAIGLQSFREDGSPLFPGRASLQQQLEDLVEFEPTNEVPLGYASQKNTGLGYKFGGQLEYRVNPKLSVGGVLSLDNARDYEESLLHVFLRYHFRERPDAMEPMFAPDLQRGALP